MLQRNLVIMDSAAIRLSTHPHSHTTRAGVTPVTHSRSTWQPTSVDWSNTVVHALQLFWLLIVRASICCVCHKHSNSFSSIWLVDCTPCTPNSKWVLPYLPRQQRQADTKLNPLGAHNRDSTSCPSFAMWSKCEFCEDWAPYSPASIDVSCSQHTTLTFSTKTAPQPGKRQSFVQPSVQSI